MGGSVTSFSLILLMFKIYSSGTAVNTSNTNVHSVCGCRCELGPTAGNRSPQLGDDLAIGWVKAASAGKTWSFPYSVDPVALVGTVWALSVSGVTGLSFSTLMVCGLLGDLSATWRGWVGWPYSRDLCAFPEFNKHSSIIGELLSIILLHVFKYTQCHVLYIQWRFNMVLINLYIYT
jgi:hypothetical protein